MVERTVGAQLAHFNAVIGTPPFMTSWKRLCCSICSVACYSLHAFIMAPFYFSSASARFTDYGAVSALP